MKTKAKTGLLKFFFIFTCLLLTGIARVSASEALVKGEEYEINLFWNEKSNPGDAVFVKINLSASGRLQKSLKENSSPLEARLVLFENEKEIRSSNFYLLPHESQKNRGNWTYLSILPLSSWWKSSNPFSLKMIYTVSAQKSMEVEIPFHLEDKEFISEEIELDQNNTDIKTNTSPERIAQIEKLNSILAQINSDHVYHTEAFSSPTKATRRTSFFADRRVYKYTNGKSSTSLHFGTDYGIPEGSPVSSCGNGRVVMAEFRISTGWSVVIEHLPGLYSLYYHLKEIKVKEGQMVKTGDSLGESGSTGLATGPHLHWEMRLNMEAVNPDFFTEVFLR